MSVAERQPRPAPEAKTGKPVRDMSAEERLAYFRSEQFGKDATAHFRRATKKAIVAKTTPDKQR